MSKVSIMFIDDDGIHNFVMESYLKYLKLDVSPSFFTDSKKALAILNETEYEFWPDIIFLDLKMPVLEGHDFVQQLQIYHSNLKQHTCLVILTASVSPIDQQEINKFQVVSDIIIKPISTQALKDVVNKCKQAKKISY